VTIVETTVWVDAFRGVSNAQTTWLSRELSGGRIALTDLILCETLQGIPDDALYQKARDYLLKFVVFDTSGVEVALAAAQNYRVLRRQGITIRGTIDCLTATFCLRKGYSLLHHDRDYDPFEKYLGLKVIHPDGRLV